MNQRTNQGRAASAAVILFASALLGLAACKKTANAPGDSATVPAADTSAPAKPEASGQGLTGYPGESGVPDLTAYLAKLDFNLEYGDRDSTAIVEYQCKAGDACAPGKTRFLVIAEKQAFTVSWPDAMNAGKNKGYVTAVYWNLDRAAVKSLNLAADSSLYQWVGPIAANGTVGIELFSLDNGTVQVASKTQTWTACTMNENRQKSAAKMKPGHTACVSQTAPGPQLPGNAANPLFPDDLWLSCRGGCCQSSPQ